MVDVRSHKLSKSCRFGFTMQDLTAYGIDLDDFGDWIYGQTVMFCEAEDCDVSHCVVIYERDVEKYLAE